MVLTFNRAWLMDMRREKAPRAFTWIVLAALVGFLGYTYLSIGRRGPYGACYARSGRALPCSTADGKPVQPSDLKTRATP